MSTAKAKRLAPRQFIFPQTDEFVVNVPVAIRMLRGKTLLKTYEDEVNLEFTDETHVGRDLKSRLAFYTQEKGYSSEEAFFLLASETVMEGASELCSYFHIDASRELQFQVKRNGRISYQRVVFVS